MTSMNEQWNITTNQQFEYQPQKVEGMFMTEIDEIERLRADLFNDYPRLAPHQDYQWLS